MYWRVPLRRGCLLHSSFATFEKVIEVARSQASKDQNAPVVNDFPLEFSISCISADEILDVLKSNSNCETHQDLRRTIFGRSIESREESHRPKLLIVPYEPVGEGPQHFAIRQSKKNEVNEVSTSSPSMSTIEALGRAHGPIRAWPWARKDKKGALVIAIAGLRTTPFHEQATGEDGKVPAQSILYRYPKSVQKYVDAKLPVVLMGGDAPQCQNEYDAPTRKAFRSRDASIELLKQQIDLLPQMLDDGLVHIPIVGGTFKDSVIRQDVLNKTLNMTGHKYLDYDIFGIHVGEGPEQSLATLLYITNTLKESVPDVRIHMANAFGTYTEVLAALSTNQMTSFEASMPFVIGESLHALVALPWSRLASEAVAYTTYSPSEEIETIEKARSLLSSYLPLPIIDVASADNCRLAIDIPLTTFGSHSSIFAQGHNVEGYPTIGYIHHLVNTHEMLAESLLVRHNCYVYESFFLAIRQLTTSLARARFIIALSEMDVQAELKLLCEASAEMIQIHDSNQTLQVALKRVVPPSYAHVEGQSLEMKSSMELCAMKEGVE